MNSRTLVQVVIKVWAALWLARVMTSLPQFFFLRVARSDDPMIRLSQSSMAVSMASGLVVASLLLVFSRRMSILIVPSEPLDIAISAPELLVVGLCILGTYFVVEGVVEAGPAIYTLLAKPKWDETSPLGYVWERERQGLVRAAVSLLVGGVLLLGIRPTAQKMLGSPSETRS
jgi:hypothetical protein